MRHDTNTKYAKVTKRREMQPIQKARSTQNHKNSEMQTGDCLHHFCHADLFSAQSFLQDYKKTISYIFYYFIYLKEN